MKRRMIFWRPCWKNEPHQWVRTSNNGFNVSVDTKRASVKISTCKYPLANKARLIQVLSQHEMKVPEPFPDECWPLSLCREINRVNLSRGCRICANFVRSAICHQAIINKIHNPPSQAPGSQNTECCETKIYWAAARNVKWTILNWWRAQ